MKLYITLSLLLIIGISCTKKQATYETPEVSNSRPLAINLEDISIEGELGLFSLEKSMSLEKEGIQIITFNFTSSSPAELQPLTIKFKFPSIDVSGFWNPRISVDKVNFYSSTVSSKASNNAPVLSFYSNDLRNRITLALSDALNMAEIRSYLKEEDVHFHPTIRLFSEKMPKTTSYSIKLRVDTRSLPYYETIDDVASWWAEDPKYKPMHVPENAKKPMYSTWYSYHQNVSKDAIVAECKIAKSLGCNAVIVDDGWQTLDSNRGYAYVGDWQPERIPDIKELVEAVHNEGMQFILWYSLPFMGENAKNYPAFKGKYLRYWDSQGTYVLDPRYPEVREYIINTYVKALNDWNLDGFKLDFIGRFTANESTVLTKETGRDYASVNEATDALMTQVTKRLTTLKPDILIEFRQPYIGPLMRKYGNMFRGVDAPNNAVANRIEVTNLRILSQNTAVHSDMFIWRNEETVEKAALQILNILYSVPQLSVKLAEVPEEHIEMIRYWFGYWNEHRDVLLDGSFIPSNPGANYPILTATKNNHQISTMFEDQWVKVEEGLQRLDIINAKSTPTVIASFKKDTKIKVSITNCLGKQVKQFTTVVKSGPELFDVPPSGMISIELE